MTRTPAVNCSIMLKDRPVEQRLAAVARAGFTAVEFWWPFETATPSEAEVDAFACAIERSGLTLTGLNLFAGDMGGGDRGIVSWPGREAEFRASTEVALALGKRLGTRRFNALYGNRLDGVEPEKQDELAVANLLACARRVSEIGGILLIEPVSGAERYPLRTAADALSVLDRVSAAGQDNRALLLDLYHLAVNGDDIAGVIQQHSAVVGHVQIADAPGRGVPGSGELPLVKWVAALRAAGYDGPVALEYTHSGADPFENLDFAAWKELA
ncbi:hydroxypyruvate isomerase family protein [Sinosporangium siamense]|uniref:Hydroxypyruvate isomerase n=1 Tax=Sinosporangium siamense TaxID=1367973 RepID=A0A919RFH9_9ACTN|nr:TIM barrel protein [Sinosporangium siamense]GII92946.1 hydroxypyruvate isomerase [Sinosporangium siamense]